MDARRGSVVDRSTAHPGVLTRRAFVRETSRAFAAAAATPVLAGCGNLIGPGEPDFQLSADEATSIGTIRDQYDEIEALARGTRDRLRVAFPGPRGTEVLALTMVEGGAADYRHLRLEREETGEVVNLLWGQDGLFPSLKLTDDRGVTIVKNGRALEVSFAAIPREGSGAISWLELGIKVAAVALAAWLGASILRVVLAGIAFVAFNVMVIAIVVAALAAAAGLIRWILSVTGWTLEDVAALFRRTVEQLREFFREVVAVLGG